MQYCSKRKACKADPQCNQLSLTQFLIMPIQRIPRYVLLLEVRVFWLFTLLQNLVENTEMKHADFSNLKVALAKMREVAGTVIFCYLNFALEYVNEKKREAENINEVLMIQDKIIGQFEVLVKYTKIIVRTLLFHTVAI